MKLIRFFVTALLIVAVVSLTACSDDEEDVLVFPSTDEPATDEPSTDEPDIDEPDEDEPDEDEPDEDDPGIEHYGSEVDIAFVERLGHLDCFFGYAEYIFSYSGALPGDEIEVTGTVTGTSKGISIRDTTVVATATEGTFGIPFTVEMSSYGFPETNPGTVDATVSISVLGEDRFEYEATETVYVVCQDCAKFGWGGDYVGRKSGVIPAGASTPIYNSNASRYDWSDWAGVNQAVEECSWNTCACVSILDWTEAFNKACNIGAAKPEKATPDNWYGTQNHMFHRQMAIGGTKTGYGSWTTPFLSSYMNNRNGKIRVSIDICPAIGRDEWPKGTLSRRDANGIIETHNLEEFEELEYIETEDDLHWTTITWETEIVGNTEHIRIQSAESSAHYNSTIFIRNFLVEQID